MSKKPPVPSAETNRYKAIIENIFFDHWQSGVTEFEFAREEIKRTADKLGIVLPDNEIKKLRRALEHASAQSKTESN